MSRWNVESAASAVCTSTFFSQKRTLVPLIRHLAKHHASPGNRTAASIAKFLGIKPTAVSTHVKRANDALALFHENDPDGSRLNFSLAIGRGGRGAALKGKNYELELTVTVAPITERFWAPHIESKRPVDLVNNAPLCFRDGKKPTRRVRYMAVNELANLPPELDGCEACFHYMSVGDFRVATRLIQLLAMPPLSKAVVPWIVYGTMDLDDPYNPSDNRTFDLKNATNAVIVGNPRVSWVVRAALEKIQPNFYLTPDDSERIFNKQSKASFKVEKSAQKAFEPDQRISSLESAPPSFVDDMRREHIVFAAVVRRHTDSRTETLLLVQNGPALDALSGCLCDDESLARVLSASKFDIESGVFPPSFELLFAVHLGRGDMATAITLALPGIDWWSPIKAEHAAVGAS